MLRMTRTPHLDANFLQGKAADTTIALIKPSELSESSVIGVDKSNDKNDKSQNTTTESIKGFKCFYCDQLCLDDKERVNHIDAEHPGKLYYPTPKDFEKRLDQQGENQ
jgi:hypothetical protein